MIKRMYKRISDYSLIIYLIFLITTVSFIASPFDHDLRVMLASANQVQYFDGNIISGVYNSWEIKGVFNRLFIFILYKLANIFVPYASGYLYETIIKTIFAIITIFITSVSVKLATNKFLINPILLLCIAYFATIIHLHIQPESICILILVLASSLFINSRINTDKKELKQFLAGILIGSIFFFKSICILMVFSFGAGMLLLAKTRNKQITYKEILTIILGSIFIFLLGNITILACNPSEFEKMANAAIYEHTLISGAGIKHIFSKFLYYNCIQIPVIFIGFIVAIDNLILNIKKRQKYEILLRIILWGIPTITILIQNCYFNYHYALYIFPTILEIYISKGKLIEILKTKYFKYENFLFLFLIGLFYLLVKIDFIKLNYTIVCNILKAYFIIVIVSGFININNKLKSYLYTKIPIVFLIGIYISYISIFSNNFYIYVNLINKMYSYNIDKLSNINIQKNKDILYLDNGISTYFVGSKSYLDEHYPLCIQRVEDKSKIQKETFYINAMNKLLKYNGEYILLNRTWFFKNNEYKNIKEKINNNYVKIGELQNVNCKHTILKKQTNKSIRYIDIYIRKDLQY